MIDKAKCVLPKIVAENLNNVPSVKGGEADVCTLMVKMKNCRKQLT